MQPIPSFFPIIELVGQGHGPPVCLEGQVEVEGRNDLTLRSLVGQEGIHWCPLLCLVRVPS